MLNNSRFLKTIKAIDNASGHLIIIKILIKPSNSTSNYNLDLQQLIELLAKESSLLSQYNNILPWHKIIETDRAGYLIRQLMKTNLYDRLSLRPFLEPIEKAFLTFQILKIIDNLHNKLHICHGDLKLENFMVTSWNWIMLADFANHIKPTYIPEDNPNQYSFYFDTSDRRLCYIAPERFYKSKSGNRPVEHIDESGKFNGKSQLTNEMDLFSMGCAIAELYLDGEPTFTLSQIFKYIRKEYFPDLSTIHEEHIREIITQLIHHSPKDRPHADTILNNYRDKCFPGFFYDFLYDYMTELNNLDLFAVPAGNDNLSSSDLKIDWIYNSYDKIAEALQFKYVKDDGISTYESTKFVPMKLNLKGMPKNYEIKPTSSTIEYNDLQQASLIILNLIFSLMKSLKQPLSKIKACELIVALSERINDDCKLDRCLPYLCNLLDEYIDSTSSIYQPNTLQSNLSENLSSSSEVACIALASITTLLMSCSYISPINVLVFPEYLLPKLQTLIGIFPQSDDKTLIKIKLAACLPYLANISKKFWMMSKSFKTDVLKDFNSRLISKPSEIDNTNFQDSYDTFNVGKDQLDSDFEHLCSILLTDSNPMVKISLVSNILPLCHYFGVEKTNDIILPHLITYLNDSNYELRLTFLSSILKIGPYVGVLSFEQYILPLLIQTLGDLEQFVILKVLEIFHYFVENRIINPKSDFNALSIYKELLSSSISLLLLPNEWIRQSVISLILAISDNLLDADKYCFLYPIVKRYLVYDLNIITWNTLYPSITKPLSKQIYELAVTWALNATNKSLFWQEKSFSVFSDLNKNKLTANILPFTKDMGKSVYIPKAKKDFFLLNNGTSNIPISPEDKQWVLKLRSVGLNDRDLWKVFILREYIYHANKNSSTLSLKNEHELPKEVNITPRNVFFEVCYKSEPFSTSKTAETNIESVDSFTKVRREEEYSKGLNSLILPNFRRAKVSLQTVQANVFGELETGHDYLSNSSSNHHHHVHSTNNSNSSHKVFSVNKQKIITANMKHSYTGYNPFILNYLHNIKFEPTLDSFSEFGNLIKPLKSLTRKVSDWKPQGICVAHIDTNSEENISGINCLAVSPSSEFVITGSENGTVKLWDAFKLEKNITAKRASLLVKLDSPIVNLKFIPNRFVFLVTTIDGNIRIFRIDVTRGKNKKITKYVRLALIRNYCLDRDEDGYFTKIEYSISSQHSLIVGTTSTSKIIGLELVKMEKEFELQNPPIFGCATTFIIHHNLSWILVGTNKGILCLWDLRFKILLKSWKLNANNDPSNLSTIRKLILMPTDFFIDKELEYISYFVMIGGTKESDISLWEIPSFECRETFSSNEIKPKVKLFSLEEIEVPKEPEIELIFSDLSMDIDDEQEKDKSMTALLCFDHYSTYYYLSATWDRRLILWNILETEKSVSLNNKNAVTFNKSKVNLTLKLNYERINYDKEPKALSDNSKLRNIALEQIETVKSHQDTINDISFINSPYEMIISADRSGIINVYK